MFALEVLERDPASLTTDHLESAVCALAAHIAAAWCRWLLMLAELDRRQAHVEWGCRTLPDWLSLRCGMARSTGREHVRVARRLGELPHVRRAFANGMLSYCKVRAITRVATPVTEQALLSLAVEATGAQMQRIVRAYQGALETIDSSAEAARHERRIERHRWNDDGSLSVEWRLQPDDGARYLALLERIVGTRLDDDRTEARTSDDVGVDDDERAARRRADAVVEIIDRAAADAGPNRSPDDDEPPSALVVVHVEAGGDMRLAGGPLAGEELARRLACDAALVAAVGRGGAPLAYGRRRRTVPRRLRRYLTQRDQGCRFPGCPRRSGLHAHHAVHWADGGATEPANTILLCRFHHRSVHEDGFRVTPDGHEGFTFRRPDGTALPCRQQPCPPGPNPAGSLARSRGPSQRAIGPDTPAARSGGCRFDLPMTIDALLCVDGAMWGRRDMDVPPCRGGP